MATSSFTKNFKITKNQSTKFANMMCKEAPLTLDKNFKSCSVSIADKEVRSKLVRALSQ